MPARTATIGLIGNLFALLASGPALASEAAADAAPPNAVASAPDDAAFVRDRLEILNVIQSITPALDEERLAEWAQVFHPDVRMIVYGKDGPAMEMRSLDTLQRFFRHRYDMQYRPQNMARRHGMSTIRVNEQTATSARAQAYVRIAFTVSRAAPVLENVGTYDMQLRKENGAWRIVEWGLRYDADVGAPVVIPEAIRDSVILPPSPASNSTP